MNQHEKQFNIVTKCLGPSRCVTEACKAADLETYFAQLISHFYVGTISEIGLNDEVKRTIWVDDRHSDRYHQVCREKPIRCNMSTSESTSFRRPSNDATANCTSHVILQRVKIDAKWHLPKTSKTKMNNVQGFTKKRFTFSNYGQRLYIPSLIKKHLLHKRWFRRKATANQSFRSIPPNDFLEKYTCPYQRATPVPSVSTDLQTPQLPGPGPATLVHNLHTLCLPSRVLIAARAIGKGQRRHVSISGSSLSPKCCVPRSPSASWTCRVYNTDVRDARSLVILFIRRDVC